MKLSKVPFIKSLWSIIRPYKEALEAPINNARMRVDVWVPDAAKPFLKQWVKPYMIGVEFGSGCSTIWLGQRVEHLVSVEHDKHWYRRTKKLLEKHNIKNVSLLYRPTIQEYLNTLNDFNDKSLDFIFVDGPSASRSHLIIHGSSKIKKDGILIADNTDLEHSKEGIKYLEEQGVVRQTFYSEGSDPWSLRHTQPWEASIWLVE